jgi:hypothetical protein
MAKRLFGVQGFGEGILTVVILHINCQWKCVERYKRKEYRLKVPRNNLTFFLAPSSCYAFLLELLCSVKQDVQFSGTCPGLRNYIDLQWKHV